MTDNNKNNRRSIRLKGYDYAQPGGYFVTACVSQRKCALAKIENDALHLHPYGKIVEQCWLSIGEHYPQVELDKYVIMPNHFHGILIIKETKGTGEPRPYNATLGQMMGYFKYRSTKEINDYRVARQLPPVTVWQRNFYEHIIRDENELEEVRRYIIENPSNWAEDIENPLLKSTL